MAKQIQLILGVSILVLGVILCTGVLQGNEGFKGIPLTAYQVESRDTREAVDNLNKALDKEKSINANLTRDFTSLTDSSKITTRLYSITNSNDTINNINAEIFNRVTKFAKTAQKEADIVGTDSSKTVALNTDKSSASAGDSYASAAASVVLIAKTVLAKADTNASAAKLAQTDAVKEAKRKQAELDDLNKKYNTAVASNSSAKSTYNSASSSYNTAVSAYMKALDTQKTNKKSKVLDDAVSTTLSTLNKLKKELDKADNTRNDTTTLVTTSNNMVNGTRNQLNKLSTNVDRLSATATVATQCATDMAKVLSRVTSYSANAAAAAAATNASVKAKVEAVNKAAAAKAAAITAALAVQAAQSDPSKKAAAKLAEQVATKAMADAAIATALAKKAADDKAAATKLAKDKADSAAKVAAAEKEASDAKIAAAKAEAVAAAKAAATKADKEAADAKALSNKKSIDAEDARKRAAKAKQDADNADAQTKTIALEKAARLQKQAEDAAKQAKLAREAHVESRALVKDVKQVVSETKKDATADLNKKQVLPKPMEMLASAPPKQEIRHHTKMTRGEKSIVINNIMPSAPVQQPSPNDNQNNFLSSAAGSFIGAGFGSLLGTSASLALHDAEQGINHGHHEHPAISITPNTMYMGKYEEPNDTKWTRGGPSMRHEARHRRHSMDRYNEDDPETARWSNKSIDPPNLYSVERREEMDDEELMERRRRQARAQGEVRRQREEQRERDEPCDDPALSEPLNRKFNVERDYSR